MIKITLIISIILFFLPSLTFGANHYVATDGTASWANSTNIATPCSLSTAFANAAAGDTVYQRAGTYTITPRITPSNGGTSESARIVFTRYQNESVIWTTSVSALEAIKLDHPYWTFSYMTWYDTHTGDTSSGDKAILKLGEDGAATNVTIDNITAVASGGGDNYGILHVKGSSHYLTVTNCDFTINNTTSLNSSTICTINIGYMTIENNKFTADRMACYFKHDTASVSKTFKNNYVNITGTPRYAVFFNGCNWTISNNVINSKYSNTNQALRFGDANGGATNPMRDNVIEHNTIYGMFWGYDDGGYVFQYNTLNNNIIYGRQTYNPGTDTNSYTTMDYNLVWANTNSMCDAEEATGMTLSQWQSKYNGVYECTNCTADTPVFIGGVAPSTISGWALSASSPGYHACSDGSSMGADVTLVGPNASGDSTAPIVSISNADPSNVTSDTLVISGTATDEVGVTSCKWLIGAAPTSSTGTTVDACTGCTGTSISWSDTGATGFTTVGSSYTLYVGCTDAAGNWGSDSITVTRGNPAALGCTIRGSYPN